MEGSVYAEFLDSGGGRGGVVEVFVQVGVVVVVFVVLGRRRKEVDLMPMLKSWFNGPWLWRCSNVWNGK